MSATIHPLKRQPSLHSVTATTLRELMTSCDDVRGEIAQMQTVAEAFATYQYLAAVAAEMATLVDLAAARCEALMERM